MHSPQEFVDIQKKLGDIVARAPSEDRASRLVATAEFKELFSQIQNIVSRMVNSLGRHDHHGKKIPMVTFHGRNDDHGLQLDAARVLAKLVSETSGHKQVANPSFVRRLKFYWTDVTEQAVRALGAIGFDFPECRNYVVDSGALEPLLDILRDHPNSELSMLRVATSTLSIFCHGRPIPDKQLAIIEGLLPHLCKLLAPEQDKSVIKVACQTIAGLTYGGAAQIQAEIIEELLHHLYELLASKEDNSIIEVACQTISKITAGSTAQMQAVKKLTKVASKTLEHKRVIIRKAVIPMIKRLLRSKDIDAKKQLKPALQVLQSLISKKEADAEIVTDACQALYSLSNGPNDLIQAMVEADVYGQLEKLLKDSSPEILKPVLRTLGNIIVGYNAEKQAEIIEELLHHLYELLASKEDNSIIEVACQTISKITAGSTAQMQIPEGSMSRMAEENKSEEMMAQVSVLQRLFDWISSPPISELLGKLKLDEALLNTLKTNLQSLDAILDDAESKTYQKTEREWRLSLQRNPIPYYEANTDEEEEEDEVELKLEEEEEYEMELKLEEEEEDEVELEEEDVVQLKLEEEVELKLDNDENLRRWLHDLKEVGYDLEDLLDQIATERLCQQFESKPWNIETYLEKMISPNIRDQLEEISSRIALVLRRGKEELGLSEASRIFKKPYPLSAAKDHIEDECQVCGRDEDKEAIIKRLLSDRVTDDIITVLPIVGKDGVGKTTIAQLVYNDYRVSKQFDLKGWASLSRNVPLHEGLIKAFSEAFNVVDSRNVGVKLNKILKMEKFLLVLDDVDNSWDWYRGWDKIRTYLLEGAKGSKILLTTRPSPSFYTPEWVLISYRLKPLNFDSSWMLFVKHALADKEIGLHPQLEAIGKNIVTKCHGLPLLIVTLGAMLRFKPSVEEWKAVLRKLSVLDTNEDMIPILRMSYDSLPPNLKRCFAYCSMFSSDHEYDKEKLVLLWMAEGFLQHSKHRRIEEVGHEYFDDLTFRSFFQKSGANSSRFLMHFLMHKLAQSVSGEFCFSFVNDPNDKPSKRVRHLSLSPKSCQKLIYCYTSHLRTVLLYCLPPGEISTHLSDLFFEVAKNWQCLRVLSLSHYTITELPDSIGALKLLRYLDLSNTKITRLPNTVTTLYSLQALLLSYCHLLSKLPKKLRRLVYLRHLDIRETCLKEMPAKMGCLTSLQSLSDFVVGEHSSSNIRELGPLKNLGGTLRISSLKNVVSARDAAEANLKNKADLKVLELKWHDTTVNSQHATNVLEKLEPHRNLEKLSIICYNGISFPGWVGDSSFSKMVFLRLSDCNNCSHLPPLGQLPSLKELIIQGMRGVKKIGPEFFGVNDVSANPFPSLEILVFREMPEWEGWIASEMQPVEFPRLKRMCIKSCPKYENHLCLCLPPSVEVDNSVSEETSMLPTEETLPKLPFTVEKQLHEGDKLQVRGKEKLQDRPSTAGAGQVEVEELQLPESIVSQRIDVSITSNRPPTGSLQHLTEVEKRKNMSTMDIVKGSMSPMAEENLSEEKMAQASILQELVRGKQYTDEKQFLEGNKAQLKRKEKLQVEELQLPDSHVVQRTDVSSYTDDSEDSQEDISSTEQESKNVSQSSQLNNLPPTLYSLEIEACDDLPFLPAQLNTLNNLQHLYIINCHLFKSIRASHLPGALKTLYIRKCEEVQFLPTAEKYKFLINLCIESSCDSLESFPLAIFPKLRNLSIWDCAKFNSLSVTEDHKFLNVLEIRNCAQFISFPEEELRIPNLTSIRLSNCKNLKVLPGLLHGLTSLQSLIINECPEVESVPKGGLPSSLNLVCISFCHKLIPHIAWGLEKLNDFSRIEIEDGSKDLESFPEQNLLPRKLFSLRISRLPNLKVLDYKGLQLLTSLKILKINSCNKLHSFPDEGLPSSLSYLYISDCPLLNSKLQKRRGKEWIKIAHIPHIQIDGNVIS